MVPVFGPAIIWSGCSNRNGARMISPRVVSKHTPDSSSPEAVVKAIIKPSMTSEQKALAIWEYIWQNTWHCLNIACIISSY